MKYLKLFGVLALLSAFLLRAPSLHYKYIRNLVSYRTVEITNTGPKLRGGGTGVHVKLPSGKVAILTNAHVCGIKDARGMVKISSPALKRDVERKVIEEADFTDLCLIEPIEGVPGLSIGSEPEPGDILAVVGHPLLMPLTMTRGEVVAKGDADVMIDILGGEFADESSCQLPKNKVLTFDTLFGKIKVCVIHIVANYTTISTFPGNSGSGVVNAWGHLAGLIFAGNSETNWGLLITVADIEKFIAPY